jgi:hypothetical protein
MGESQKPRTLIALLGAAVALALPSQAPAARPLETGIHEHLPIPWVDIGNTRIRATGASTTRLLVYWRSIAPETPVGLNATDPGAPQYNWANLDRQVESAVAHGLAPIIFMTRPPLWAQPLGQVPSEWGSADPSHLSQFMTAIARRYNGNYKPVGRAHPLPAVRRWEIWNEPNLARFFQPQFSLTGQSAAPYNYHNMVNAAAAAIHAVNPANFVIAGATSPFGGAGEHTPLDFMRKVLCIGPGSPPQPICSTRIEFDAWSHHPYTQGGPTHHAWGPDNVSIGDLPEMRRVLNAAVRAGHVRSARPPELWVTEFSWDTKPPDPKGISSALHARWTSEALYRMWRAGVSHVTWWLLRDQPLSSPFQSGFYFCGARTTADDGTCNQTMTRDRRKPSFRAFRFPFVAFARSRGVYTWGRTPFGRPARVVVERSAGSGWRRLGVLRTNQYGIFQRTWRGVSGRGVVRARIVRGERSRGFSLKRVPDRFIELTFGCGGTTPC